jgi:hypothetical protein
MMHAKDHYAKDLLFNDLSMNSFGFGGDPGFLLGPTGAYNLPGLSAPLLGGKLCSADLTSV